MKKESCGLITPMKIYTLPQYVDLIVICGCVCVAYKLSSLDNKNEKDSSVHRIAENFHWFIIFV